MRGINHSLLLALGVVGCGGDPVDVAGNYTVAVTNRDNGCNFANWTVGEEFPGIPVVVTQDGGHATAVVTGPTGGFMVLVLGSNSYQGSVDGDELDLTLYGTRSQTTGTCTFTYTSEIVATSDGDLLTGRINYRPQGNGSPDCTECLTYQDFNGIRPP
jgi:hypothetical protein